MGGGVFHSKSPSGSAPATEAIWSPHWGVDLADYEESGKIAILARNDVLSKFKCDTTTGDWRISVIGSAGVERTIDTADNTYYELDLSADANAFPDTLSNGYETFVLLIEALTGDISEFGCTVPTGEGTFYATLTGFLWIKSDIAGRYAVGDSTRSSKFLECLDIPDMATCNVNYCYSLVKCGGVITSVNVNSGARYCSALKEYKGHDFDATYYTESIYNGCYILDNDINGIYPNTTRFSNTFSSNRARRIIDITAPNCTTWYNQYMYGLQELTLDMPLTVFNVWRCYNLKKIILLNTNFKSLGSTTNAIYIRDLSVITATELTRFLTDDLEDLTGYVAQTIYNYGVSNWDSSHTALANDKNWNVSHP